MISIGSTCNTCDHFFFFFALTYMYQAIKMELVSHKKIHKTKNFAPPPPKKIMLL